jgi:hypothetical protein
MKKIAVLSALVLLSASVAAGRFALTANSSSTQPARPMVDDPPPEPIECPLCGGNPTLHARRMQVIEKLQGEFIAAALRW